MQSASRFIFTLIVLTIGFSASLFGQSSVDLTFNAVPSNPLPADTSFQQIVQPDGKVIVYGAPTMFVNGELRNSIFRLNTDGSTDSSFAYNGEGAVGISSVMVAPDGKIVLAGSTAPNHAKMVRLNSNGSLDSTFSVFVAASGSPELTHTYFTLNAIQADGKVIATRVNIGNIGGTWSSYGMARYNLDGTVDSSFVAPTLDGGHLVSTSALIELLPDGRFYLAISSGNHLGRSMTLTRRMANGTVDTGFSQFTRSLGGGFFISFSDLALASDGGVFAAGLFSPSMIGGPYNKNLYKFLPSGAVDPGFNPPLSNTTGGVHAQLDGKVLHSVQLVTGGPTRIIRLAADGSTDNTYVMDPAVTAIKNTWVSDAMNRAVFLAQTSTGPRLVRLLENGSIDSSFNPILGAIGNVTFAATQTDGKAVVTGSFTKMNGVERSGFARLNTDGSLDTTFDPGTAFNVAPRKLLIQPDGKIIAVGNFLSYSGTPIALVARINAEGTIDNSFSLFVSGSSVDCVALQSDGKIMIGGTFTQVNGVGRNGLARLEPNGALDTTFSPIVGGNAYVGGILVEPNGKIAIVGNFTGVNGADRSNFARLEANGTTDLSFNAGGIPSTAHVRRQPDGKYITFPNGATIERRHVDGSRDTSFTSPTFRIGGNNGYIEDLLLRPDGTMIVAGEFNNLGGASRGFITRLFANGTHDASFLTTGANARVTSLAVAQSDKVFVTGIFNSIENVSRLGIARLNVPEVQRTTPFDFDGDGRSDISVFRPSENKWFILRSSDFGVTQTVFAVAGDIPIPADFDGDAKTDLAIFRPSNGDWWYLSSINNAQINVHWGANGDIPRPSDFDADGKADFVVFRPAENNWYRLASTGQISIPSFGAPGDKPVIGDFDGDGKSDPAVFRPSTGDWWYAASSLGGAHRVVHWGANGDIPAPGDYDGDGKTDFAVFRPSEGGWYVYKSFSGSFITTTFGLAGDRPIPADYDGDGSVDIAVFRPSTGIWYLLQSTAGFGALQWGISTDVAVPNAFVQ